MRIEKGQVIVGRPAREIRDLLRSGPYVTVGRAVKCFGSSKDEARLLLTELERAGYIVFAKDFDREMGRYSLTADGARLAAASAARPITRQSADRIVREMLGRIEEINRDTKFAFCVGDAAIFGSYLTDKERISDVDVAFRIVPRYADEATQKKAEHESRLRANRELRTIFEQIIWPQTEVQLFLKSRVSALSFCDWYNFEALEREGLITHKLVLVRNCVIVHAKQGDQNEAMGGAT